MKLSKFIDFNSNCPLCDRPLSLYLQIVDSVCFKGEKLNDSGKYKFTPFKCKDNELDDTFCIIGDHYDTDYKKIITQVSFSSNELKRKALENQAFMFFLCNPEGFKDNNDSFTKKQDYEINMYYASYYRSTPFFDFIKDDNDKITPKFSDELYDKKIINSDESLSMTRIKDGIERVYMVNIDYEHDKTVLWYYSVTEEQAKQKSYTPNIFEKSLPSLKRRPKFDKEHIDKFIDRLDNWILMS